MSGVHCHIVQLLQVVVFCVVYWLYRVQYFSILISSPNVQKKDKSSGDTAGTTQKCQAITMETEAKLIEKVDQGEKMVNIACSYNMSHSTIGMVLNNKDEIMEHVKSAVPIVSTVVSKVCLVKAVVFPVVMYGCESWTMKMWKLDHKEGWAPKNWCFWTVVLEKTLESPLDCKEIKLVILKEINPECSLEGLTLKLKLQYFGHVMRRADSLERPWCQERFKAGGEGDNRGWDG